MKHGISRTTGRSFRRRLILGAFAALLMGVGVWPCFQASPPQPVPEPKIPFSPPAYVCGRASQPLTIDGRLDEPAWHEAAWTASFVDIEGPLKPEPRFGTRVKMLWDDDHFFIGAELEEPDIWATLTRRDSVIFQDNDFEVFIDPSGSTHLYYELEVNALGTEWDLLLVKPYRDGGPAVHAWDIRGLQTAVFPSGTINRPGDKDQGWTIEIAMPWEVLKECAPGKKPPSAGDQWRVDFSRVEYQVDVKDGKSIKVADPKTGRPLPEDNWVWAPTGLVNIHYPEMWGYVQFSADPPAKAKGPFRLCPEEAAKWALRQVYYAERRYFLSHGEYADELADLGLGDVKVEGFRWPPRIQRTRDTWEAFLEKEGGRGEVCIFGDGLVIEK
jgi:hypothetical protein